MLGLSLGEGPAAADLFGLDERPSNPTCLAPTLSGGGTGTLNAVRAFGALGFTAPTQVRQHPADASRFYVSERRGLIKTFVGGGAGLQTALDIHDRMRFTSPSVADSEQWGIMSFAFHPNFPQSPFLYVAYNRKPSPTSAAHSYLSRFRANPDGRTFSGESESVLIDLAQRLPWHHFGQLQFGPDNRLYLGSGDGGDSAGAQLSSDLNGKILRIDVNASPVRIEAYAKGLRNPWRFDFDGGDLWVGDVGRNTWEEINRIRAAGGNFGWPIFEGPQCMQGNCNTPGLIRPLHFFNHSVGTAIIGGTVYHGSAAPSLRDHYIFGVFSSPQLMALVPPNYTTRINIARLPSGRPTGFFRDRQGELYIVDTVGNAVWKLVGSGDAGALAEAEPVPLRLSDTGCVKASDPRSFATGVIPYDLNQPLWSDGAAKQRGMALANGQRITRQADGDFQFPPRTVLVKEFAVDGRTIETRLLMNHPGDGWRGYSYEWINGDGQLVPAAGKTKTIPRGSGTISWLYPSRQQCLQCHTEAAGVSLGLETAQLNRDFTYFATGRTANQIETLKHIGLFVGAVPPAGLLPALATRTSGTATQRARSYLHANCSFCHRPGGGAQANIDFRFDRDVQAMNICNEPPLTTNLGIAGARLLLPGEPSKSMISVRIQRRDQFGMPPLGTRLVDTPMVAAINDWIRTPGVCN